MSKSLTIAMCVICCCVGCAQKVPAAAPQVRQQSWPTADRPIVLNETDRGGGLVFGGPDGKLRVRLENKDAFARYAISQDARHAACVTIDWYRTRARWVTFFDCSGRVAANVMLPPPPATKKPMFSTDMWIRVSNNCEAVVTISQCEHYEGPVRPVESTAEYYYVQPSGSVQMIPANLQEELQFFFPPVSGVVVLRTDREWQKQRPWQVERYAEGLRFFWKTEVVARNVWPRKASGFDFGAEVDTDQGRYTMLIHADGSTETAPYP